MEEALWKYICALPQWGNTDHVPEMPKVFKSRVKKLLNIDRASGAEKNNWVFFESAGEGTGTQESYSDFHVFMMGIALYMLNIGFKQSEIIFFLQHTQQDIKKRYNQIRSSGDVAPIWGANRSEIENAVSHFMLINRVEMQETVPALSGDNPIIMCPVFVKGLEGLKKELHTYPNLYTAFTAIELADIALTLPALLSAIPAAGRGRPAA
ncbi:MAG: hypothetical protein AABY33_03865 [Pseudomonadota bacterium]